MREEVSRLSKRTWAIEEYKSSLEKVAAEVDGRSLTRAEFNEIIVKTLSDEAIRRGKDEMIELTRSESNYLVAPPRMLFLSVND